MKLIDNKGVTDPRINLAIEEYALMHLPNDDDYLLFYMNEPSIIIGKNQNTYAEVNEAFVREHGIHVVRRLSGGGAVYHDLGNLNFSFITDDDGNAFLNFQKFTEPVVQALRALGVEAELSGRNDLVVGGRKISGNAQYAAKGRMFSHGTLMFHSEIDNVVNALNVDETKLQSKGIRSIRSRVANISDFLREPMTIEAFKEHLLQSIFQGREPEQYVLTEDDWQRIAEISRNRYQNWEWNYGRSPEGNFRQTKRFAGGTVEVRLRIAGGRIQSAQLYGDFFGSRDIAELEARLAGVPYDRENVLRVLQDTDLNAYFGQMEAEELADLFF